MNKKGTTFFLAGIQIETYITDQILSGGLLLSNFVGTGRQGNSSERTKELAPRRFQKIVTRADHFWAQDFLNFY
jgi:hypothetical protein